MIEEMGHVEAIDICEIRLVKGGESFPGFSIAGPRLVSIFGFSGTLVVFTYSSIIFHAASSKGFSNMITLSSCVLF